MLPFLMSILGSGLAGAGGAGILAGMSPLVAGSLGAGLGTAIETGDIEKGLLAGLGGFAGGSVLGNLMGGASNPAMAAATQGTGNQAAQQLAQQAAPQAAQGGLGGMFGPGGAGGMLNKILPGGPGLTPVSPPAAATSGAGTGGLFGGQAGNMIKQGFNQGIATGGGVGSALLGGTMYPKTASGGDEGERRGAPRPPLNRKRYDPNDPRSGRENLYFDPRGVGSTRRYAEGGVVDGGIAELMDKTGNNYFHHVVGGRRADENPVFFAGPTGAPPIAAAAKASGLLDDEDERRKRAGLPVKKYMNGGMVSSGGLGDMPADMMQMPNERDVIGNAIKALNEELPEEQAAIALAQFVKAYGEQALRKLVSDVRSGRTPERQDNGLVTGPTGRDQVPAEVAQTGEPILVDDGETIVPSDMTARAGRGDPNLGAERIMQAANQLGGGMR